MEASLSVQHTDRFSLATRRISNISSYINNDGAGKILEIETENLVEDSLSGIPEPRGEGTCRYYGNCLEGGIDCGKSFELRETGV